MGRAEGPSASRPSGQGPSGRDIDVAESTGKDIDLRESVAGEEDPGASVDIAASNESPGRGDQPAGVRGDQPTGAAKPMSPGDEAPPGTIGTGEDVCRACGGKGILNGGPCPECEGTGKINVGIGGA